MWTSIYPKNSERQIATLELAIHRAKLRRLFWNNIVEFGSLSQSISTTWLETSTDLPSMCFV